MFDYTQIKKMFPHYKEKIRELTRSKHYAYSRYGLEFATALIYSESPISMEVCSGTIRQSDNIYALEENLFLVVFDMVNSDSSLKAAQNFLYAYQQFDVRQELYILVAPIQQDWVVVDMSNRLFSLLEYALKEHLANSIVDISLMHSKSWM